MDSWPSMVRTAVPDKTIGMSIKLLNDLIEMVQIVAIQVQPYITPRVEIFLLGGGCEHYVTGV